MNQKKNPTEKEIGDLTVRVVPESDANGPFSVRVFGGARPRTLACRFQTEADATEYLSHVSSRTLMQARG